MKTNYHREFYETNARVSATSAMIVLNALLEVYRARTLLDVGCGIGTWVEASQRLGFTRRKGVDGNYISRSQLMIAADEFLPHDLRRPLVLNEKYDLAICMEVAEHLPPETAPTLVHSLCMHSPVVMFSAAIPRQGGIDHINEQWQSYWAELFAGEGYEVCDCIRPRVWNVDAVAEYYKQNVLLYVDRNEKQLISLFRADSGGRNAILNLVHPATYQIKADPMRWPLLTVIRYLPKIVARVLRNRVLPR